jgi:hypothetical protein
MEKVILSSLVRPALLMALSARDLVLSLLSQVH